MVPSDGSSEGVELVPAYAAERAVLENLLELYCHDFSEWLDLPIGPDGRFGYSQLDSYLSDADHHPFLIRADGKLAGFVLVRRTDQNLWEVAEFFVLRGYRRRGVGKTAAQKAFCKLPGSWQVRVMEANAAARTFWDRAIRSSGVEQIEVEHSISNGKNWAVYSFISPQP